MPSITFNYQDGWQSWNVPAKVQSVDVVVKGAGSGAVPGGRCTGKIAVDPDQTLKFLVGEAGHAVSGHNGGGTSQGGGGAGGDGNGSGNDGGNGGGGGSFVRRNTPDGQLIAAAGGAGGASGDNGGGGRGGAANGEHGDPGNSGSQPTGNSTGGTQSQGGNGGTSSSGQNYWGGDGDNSVAGRGGHGGTVGNGPSHGGGGGGGGYRPGGGGQASNKSVTPGGGGAGGSNYTGGLTSWSTDQGNGGVGNGEITITWSTPNAGDQAPNPPSNVKVNDKSEQSEMATKATDSVSVSATLSDSDQKNQVRLIVQIADQKDFSSGHREFQTKLDNQQDGKGHDTVFELSSIPVRQDTLYYLHLYTEDEHGRRSGVNTASFWTNRRPKVPTLHDPANGRQVTPLDSVVFTWTHNDPDPDDPQSGYEWQWRRKEVSGPQGDWHVVTKTHVPESQHVADPGAFSTGQFYEWTVRTQDQANRWGDFAVPQQFYVQGVSTPPDIIAPDHGDGVDATEQVLLRWRFNSPLQGETQTGADIRFRLVGQTANQWVTRFGGPGKPGSDHKWLLPEETFASPGYHYEWQARTYNTSAPSLPSNWSESATFWTTGRIGGLSDIDTTFGGIVQGSLGCGTYRVFVFDQGGRVMRGELDPLSSLTFGRLRDDISKCVVQTNGFDDDCGRFLKTVRSWLHEIVVFRDGKRVWEGPITRISYAKAGVEFEAKDVMGYLYRRVLRNGFNDSYREVNGEVFGLPTVVERARTLIVNALAYSDPHLLPYLTSYRFSDDARESRVVADYAMTVWEEVDDLAANAGLDYTAVGRRIILWDTHRPIGRLPEMRDDDFSDPPVVTEYGMQLCNYFAVTNNAGVWGAARPDDQKDEFDFYGPIEMLASSFSEAEGTATKALTPAARDRLEKSLREQARRNIAHRWPTPLIVRVPDNSALSPEAGVGFDQLIPGVWIPVRSSGTLRDVSQWQKLDSVTVTLQDGVEKVQVVMSPAPNGGQDPDEGSTAEAP